MRYKLTFTPSAIKAFSKLHPSMREQLKKKLVERLNEPHVPKARLKYLLNTYI